MNEDSFDLFAPSAKASAPSQEVRVKVLPFPNKQEESTPHASPDEKCCGCFFMGWGKRLRRICRNANHPGPVGQKAFCLNDAGKPESYVPFNKVAPGRLSLEEMVQNNLI